MLRFSASLKRYWRPLHHFRFTLHLAGIPDRQRLVQCNSWLVVASFVAFLQFPWCTARFARPYASGLCFAMLMVFFWTKVIFHPQRKYYQNLLGYIISGALCAYNHHFSMLFAAMVGLPGYFFAPVRKHLNILQPVCQSSCCIFPICLSFFINWALEALKAGWTNPGTILSLITFNIFSISLYISTAYHRIDQSFIILVPGKAPRWQKVYPHFPDLVFTPLSHRVFYSRYRSSVLQYSVLIFSFPFLCLYSLDILKLRNHFIKQSWYRSLEWLSFLPWSLSGNITNCFTRAFTVKSWQNRNGWPIHRGQPVAWWSWTPKRKSIHTTWTSWNVQPCHSAILKTLRENLHCWPFWIHARPVFLRLDAFHQTNWENYALMMEKFPYLIQHKSYCGGDFYLFSRIKPVIASDEYFYVVTNTFEPSLPEWGWVNEKRCIDSLPIDGKKSFVNDFGQEFSPSYTKSLRDLIHSENDVIDVSVDVRIPLVFPGAWLVLSVSSDGKDLKWSSAAVNDYVKPGHQGRVFSRYG